MAIGEQLRKEREARGVSIEEIAAATGIGRVNLEALEANAYNALSGRAKFYVRAYAKTLGFDPRPMIDRYDRELEAMAPAAETRAEPERAAQRPVEAAIARWRKTAMASHAGMDAADPHGFDDDDPDDEIECEADAIEQARPPAPQLDAEPAIQHPSPEEDVPARAAEPLTEAGSREADAPEAHVPPAPMRPAVSQPVPEVDARVVPALIEHAAPRRASDHPYREAAPPTRSRVRVAVALMVGLIVVLAGVRLIVRINADGGESAAKAPASEERETLGGSGPLAGRAPLKSETPPPATSEIETAPPRPANPLTPTLPIREEQAAPAGALTVTESGVGRRIVNHRLADLDDAFSRGDVVWFSTRVMGGRSGQRIRHVWMRDGRVEQSIPLQIGGADWRTHSRKTIWYPGSWTVEARDEQGRVLATGSFTSAPGGRS